MSSDQLVTVASAFIGAAFATIMGIVKVVAPRLDKGYKTAIDIQERRYEEQKKSQGTLEETIARLVENETTQTMLMGQQIKLLERMAEGLNGHDRDSAVHRERVDQAMIRLSAQGVSAAAVRGS